MANACRTTARPSHDTLTERPILRCDTRSHYASELADPARLENTYVREDKLLTRLTALHQMLTSPATRARRRTRAGVGVRSTVSPGEVIGYLREHEITLTWNPAAAALQARATQSAKTATIATL
jgi:hypothetical protein